LPGRTRISSLLMLCPAAEKQPLGMSSMRDLHVFVADATATVSEDLRISSLKDLAFVCTYGMSAEEHVYPLWKNVSSYSFLWRAGYFPECHITANSSLGKRGNIP